MTTPTTLPEALNEIDWVRDQVRDLLKLVEQDSRQGSELNSQPSDPAS